MINHIVYQTTNKVNGKIYVGYHRTENLNDSYLGSGVVLAHAIKKYGIENFERSILFVYEDEALARAKEAEIVNPEFLKRKDVYNLNVGGFGSSHFNVSSGKCHSPEANAKRSDTLTALWGDRVELKQAFSERMKTNNPMHDPVVYAAMVERTRANPSMRGVKGSDHPTHNLVTVFDLLTKETYSVPVEEFQSSDYLVSPSQSTKLVVNGVTFYNLRKAVEFIWTEFDLAGDVDYLFIQNNRNNMTLNKKLYRKGHMKAYAPKTWNELGIFALQFDRQTEAVLYVGSTFN